MNEEFKPDKIQPQVKGEWPSSYCIHFIYSCNSFSATLPKIINEVPNFVEEEMGISPEEGRIIFARKSELELITKRIDAFANGYRQNLAIIGAPRVGKTSLVSLSVERTRRGVIHPIVFSCFSCESVDRFCDRWMAEILMSFHQFDKDSQRPSFQNLLKSVRPKIPDTVRHMKKVKKTLFRRKYDQAFREMLRLTAIAEQESGKKIVMVLDDFDRLSELKLSDPFSMFGHEIMVQKETMFIVISSKLHESRTILRDKLSLLFGNFEAVHLSPFKFEEAIRFFKEQTKERVIPESLMRFLIRLTDGHPFYLKTLLNRLNQYQTAASTGEIAREDFLKAIVDELCEESGQLHHYFERRLLLAGNGFSWACGADFLAAIATGRKKITEIVRFLHRPFSEAKKIVQKLMNREMLEKHGSLLSIPDSLFRFWLGSVYYYRRFSYGLNETERKREFIHHVEQQIELDTQADATELPKRIEELFRHFRNDSIDLKTGKTFICPHFSEIMSKPNNGRVFPVIAKNGKTRWMCQIVSRKIVEEDIQVFKEDLKRLRAPVQKRLMVGLKGIDLNAKLLAQEAKIQYLDLRKFNFLLDLYGKPKIII